MEMLFEYSGSNVDLDKPNWDERVGYEVAAAAAAVVVVVVVVVDDDDDGGTGDTVGTEIEKLEEKSTGWMFELPTTQQANSKNELREPESVDAVAVAVVDYHLHCQYYCTAQMYQGLRQMKQYCSEATTAPNGFAVVPGASC
eukprot:ANDGO_07600.mRNA.1 hypothetical protein